MNNERFRLRRTARTLSLCMTLVLCQAVIPRLGVAQPEPRPGQTLFQLDLSRTAVGDFPASLDMRRGIMEVVQKNGRPMLKASAESEFVIQLSNGLALPREFTLEFVLIPKMGSNPQDLSFEGTDRINQGEASAHVLWHATGSLAVIGGGGDTYETPMPEDFQVSLPGVLTQVVAEVEGPTIRLYTNGRRLFTLQKQFARGNALRVFLGAQNAGTEAVYLAGLRIRSGAAGVLAANPTPPPGEPAPAGQPQQPTPQPEQPASGGGSTVISGLAVRPGILWGATLEWTFAEGVATYLFEFSDAGGPFTAVSIGSRGNAQNSVQPGLTRTGMSQLLPGHQYQFRITAKAGDGTAMGSAVQSYSTPADWPRVANLSIAVGELEQLPVLPNSQIKPARNVTWTYDPLPGGVGALATFDRIFIDPVTRQAFTLRAPAAAMRFASGSSMAVEAGTRLRLCVSVIENPYLPGQGELMGEACRDVDIPAGDATSNRSEMVGTVGSRTIAVTVTMQANGPLVSWPAVAGASGYSVRRWKLDDAGCCNASVQNLTSLQWQDAQLAIAGTYVYEVTATGPAWTATGQAQFVQFKSPGQIASVDPVPATPQPGAPPASPGAISQGPVTTTQSGARTGIPGAIPPRTIAVVGFNAAGSGALVPRTIVVTGFTAAGPKTAQRTITVTGSTALVAPRTLTVPGFTASGSTAIPPRTISVAGWSATGTTNAP